MSLRTLPEIKAFERPDSLQWDAPSGALDKWAELPFALSENAAEIGIYDVIGADFEGKGWTAKRVAGILASLKGREVTVSINSPGGDFFEGLAIYNVLREYPAKVSIKVMGLAASAASVIAMAGDEIHMGDGAFYMIHNAWAVAVGNRHDMNAAAKLLEPFDASMADIYTARTGQGRAYVAEMMDAESWINAADAVKLGFADFLLPAAKQTDARSELPASVAAKRKMEAALARQGMPRSERRKMISEISGARDAAEKVTPDADRTAAALAELLEAIRG